MLKLFLQFEFGKIRKYFRTRTVAKIITALLFLVVFAFLAAGVYGFFVSGFRYVYFGIEEAFRMPLFLFIYEVFLLVLTGMIILSVMVSGVFTLFRGESDAWLVSTPGYRAFPKLVFSKSILSSTWPLIVMFLPVALAFERMYSLGFWGLLLITASVALLLFLANTLTLSVVILIGYIYFIISRVVSFIRFRFKGFMFLLLLAVVANLAYFWHAVSGLDLVSIFKADNADAVITVSNIGSYFSSYPTHLLAMEIIQLQMGNWVSALAYAQTLLVITLISILSWWLLSPLFYPLWQAFQEGSSREEEANKAKQIKQYNFGGGPIMALFKKELLVATRNWKGVLWSSFLAVIWLIQIGGSVIMEHNIRKHEANIVATMATLQTIQFAIAAYFICAFTLRFVFPAFSVEKKTAWILASAPVSSAKLFFGKYLFFGSFFVALGLFMNYVNVAILHVSVAQALYSTSLLVVTIITIVTFGMVLGAKFPNKESDDPEVISTSMSGLFFTTVSLLYGGAGAWTLNLALTTGDLFALEAFIATSVVIVLLALARVPAMTKQSIFD